MNLLKRALIVIVFSLLILSALPYGEAEADEKCCAVYHNGSFTDYQSLIDGLNAATGGDTVVVYDGCSLTTDATVKEGVTLLVPFKYSDDPSNDWNAQGGDPSTDNLSRKKAGDSYCVSTLTISKSSTLTVNGTLVVGGVTGEKFTFDYQGHTSGKHGKIVLEGKIVLQKTGSKEPELRCYGYIKGNGTIIADAGTSVYEPFIITDYVGGDYAKELYDNNQSAFGRYTFSNIECDLTVKYGSKLIGFGELYADKTSNRTDISIIGTDSDKPFLRLRQGAELTISYDPDKYVEAEWSSNIYRDVGKTTVTVTGGGDFEAISISYSGRTIDLSETHFSIPYNFDYVLKSGTYNINSNLRILPGASITVSEDATLYNNRILQVYDGLVDVEFKDKYYPTPKLLKEFDFDTKGCLTVDGHLYIGQGASVLGVIESLKEGSVIVVDQNAGWNLDLVGYGVNWQSDGQRSYYSTRTLGTWVYDSYGTRVLLSLGGTYVLSLGTSTSDGFTYNRDGKEFTEHVDQRFYGIIDNSGGGDITVEADANGYLRLEVDDYTVGKNIEMIFPGDARLEFEWESYASKTYGLIEVIYSIVNGKDNFDMRFDSGPMNMAKTVTVSYDVSKKMPKLVCDDSYTVDSPIWNGSAGTVTFVSAGNVFHIEYEPDAEPFDTTAIILFAVLVVVLIGVVIMVLKRKG
ncbi:MAG: hypothetical protein IKQ67_02170 [Candidatus Methanomethylophilaceae archaeon]|nr:hypothetical protein [Candidatus Methanomethylophilaceae archaeon]